MSDLAAKLAMRRKGISGPKVPGLYSSFSSPHLGFGNGPEIIRDVQFVRKLGKEYDPVNGYDLTNFSRHIIHLVRTA